MPSVEAVVGEPCALLHTTSSKGGHGGVDEPAPTAMEFRSAGAHGTEGEAGISPLIFHGTPTAKLQPL